MSDTMPLRRQVNNSQLWNQILYNSTIYILNIVLDKAFFSWGSATVQPYLLIFLKKLKSYLLIFQKKLLITCRINNLCLFLQFYR